ncbi:glycosyltransferase family 31 protein, partial [Cadophora sp. DSE1049]
LSDSLAQIRELGMLPFGGGGIFLSVPLAASLVRPEVWDACLSIPNDQGDQIVNECLNAYSSIRPSFDYGLQQMDIKGDASGYFESGRRMLTVHHWRTWYDVNVPLASNVSKVCGFECVFQRWAFEDNFVLSNGFSVVEYTKGIEEGEVELGKVEKTWEGDARNFVHHIGPLREPMVREEKRSTRLVEGSVLEGVGVRQVYIERVKSGENGERVDGDVDRVVELLWLF